MNKTCTSVATDPLVILRLPGSPGLNAAVALSTVKLSQPCHAPPPPLFHPSPILKRPRDVTRPAPVCLARVFRSGSLKRNLPRAKADFERYFKIRLNTGAGEVCYIRCVNRMSLE